jgi:hypothetical protein
MGWTIKGLEFEYRWGQEFSLLYVVQTGFGVHPTSYPMGTVAHSQGVNYMQTAAYEYINLFFLIM